MKKLAKILAVVSLGLLTSSAWAVDLFQAYQQALDSDPTFQIARAQWLADKENIAISRAGLLPTFDVSASYGRSYNENTHSIATVSKDHYYDNTGIYLLTLTQPVFNYQAWAQLKSSKSFVKSSAATYAYAAQDLIYRTASAYLNVLQAIDVLRYDRAYKDAIASQLDQTKAQYSVGLATITQLYQAQASYDSATAQVISDANNLDIQKEKLREITGQHYSSFAQLSRSLPLVTPNTTDINRWVNVARQQNYNLLAARYDVETAQENIRVEGAANLPTVNAKGSYGQQYDSNMSGYDEDNVNTAATAQLSLDFPVVQGGGTIARTRQAEYNYEKANATLEQTDRSVVSSTRQAYLSVLSGIGEVQANKQAVVSARSSLEATQESYKVGTETMIDVLNELSNLYSTEKTLTTSQYNYLIQTLALKEAAGTLSVIDIQTINSWLKPEASVVETKKVVETKPVANKKVANKTETESIKPVVTPKEQQPVTPIVKKVACKPREATAEENKLLAVDSSHYTIQLLAARDSKTIIDFMNKYHVSGNVYTIKTYSNNANLYQLILGDYASIEQAKTAVQQLPTNIQMTNPWIRKYASVHQAIQQGLCH